MFAVLGQSRDAGVEGEAMTKCSGSDRTGSPCERDAWWGSPAHPACYFHAAVKAGTLTSYVDLVWRSPEGERARFVRELVSIGSKA